jgi:hypothetical protein
MKWPRGPELPRSPTGSPIEKRGAPRSSQSLDLCLHAAFNGKPHIEPQFSTSTSTHALIDPSLTVSEATKRPLSRRTTGPRHARDNQGSFVNISVIVAGQSQEKLNARMYRHTYPEYGVQKSVSRNYPAKKSCAASFNGLTSESCAYSATSSIGAAPRFQNRSRNTRAGS